jgi:type II secretory pathway component GspD/PulD (secretin)
MASPAVVGAGPELEQKVTINVKGATLDAFLAALSEQTHVNIAVDEAVADKRVTAFLNNVTAREALEVVMTIKGLTCRRLEGKTAYAIEGQEEAFKNKLDLLNAGDRVKMRGVSPR